MKVSKILFLIAVAAGCATALRAAELADSLLAVVSEVPITQQGVERYTGQEELMLGQQFQNQPDVMRSRILSLREIGLQTLVTREIILHDFKQTIKVPESIIDDIVQERIKERFHGDNVELTKQLEVEGITREQYKQRIRDQFIVESMRAQFVPEPIISPLKIETYYNGHKDEFKIKDQIKMRMIVLKKSAAESDEQVRKRAEEILSQIKGGASVAELAKSYSEGSQAAQGGETGWEDTSVVNKTLADELAKLQPGQNSGVIDMPDGYYILLLEDRSVEHFKPLNDVRVQIEKYLSGEETERLSKQWIDRLRKKTFVQHF